MMIALLSLLVPVAGWVGFALGRRAGLRRGRAIVETAARAVLDVAGEDRKSVV